MRYPFIVFLLFVIAGCTSSETDSNSMLSESTIEKDADFTNEAEEWADSLISSMTLEEQIGQLFIPAILSDTLPATRKLLRSYLTDLHVGGILLLRGDMASAAFLCKEIRQFSSITPWIAADAEWGLGMRFSDAPQFPKNAFISHNADEQTLYDYGYEVAREAEIIGINMILGPVSDVASHPNGIMNTRSLGSDPQRVALLASAYASGAEAGGIITVAKHFPGHGSTTSDSHYGLPVIQRTMTELDSIDLLPFRLYAKNRLSAIMIGHIYVKAIDNEPIPATFSHNVITKLLRDSIKFKGMILTDAINMKGACNRSAYEAIAAGTDIIIAPADTRKAIAETIKAIKDGAIPISTIKNRCRRILFYKYRQYLNRSNHSFSTAKIKENAQEIANRLM